MPSLIRVPLVDILLAGCFWLSVGAIFYTYLGYPLLVFLLARFFPKKPGPVRQDSPSVTFLIAAWNEETIIEAKLENSLAIQYPRDCLQILVVTDGSSDATPELVEQFCDRGVELLHQPERRGKMAAINRALPYARGEIIVFSDANNFYRPDALGKLIAPFSDPAVGGVSGAKVIAQEGGSLGASEGLYWKYESFIKVQESRLGSCTSAPGEILAIRRQTYREPPANIINDDFYIAMQVVRQGYRLIYVPDAISYERVSPTSRDEIVRRTRINAGRYQTIALAREVLPWRKPLLLWQIASHKFLRPLVPFFMIGAAITNLLILVIPPEGPQPLVTASLVFLLLQAAFYALALLGSLTSFGGKWGRLGKMLYLPAFLTHSNLAALRGLVMYLRGGNLHLWQRIQRG